MNSTDHNLNNPMEVDSIYLHPTIDANKAIQVQFLTREKYDLLNPKDPYVVYIVDEGNGEINKYYGEILVKNGPSKINRYVMGPSIDKYGEYNIYANNIFGNTGLTYIATFKDVQTAIDMLHLYNNTGTHSDISIKIYKIVVSYINKNISIHELLISIISELGYKNTPELQHTIQLAITFNALECKNDLPIIFREELHDVMEWSNNCTTKLYAIFYDLVVKYNFFKDDKYHKDELKVLDLSDFIRDVLISVKIL